MKTRFDSIDAVRGLGAFAVVVWHWQHMLLAPGPRHTWPPAGGIDRALEPFYVVLKPFYEYGFWAVDLFFVISGFIFYLLYRESVAAGRTRARDFFFLRLSRLWPLHVITLLIVAVLQYFFWMRTQQTFVYVHNDLPHFIGNLFLINAPVYSFNGPTWALTVEAALYAAFWPLARLGLLKHWPVTLALAGVGLWMLLTPGWIVWGRGVAGFFVGGLACAVFLVAKQRDSLLRIFSIAAGLGWAATLTLAYAQPNLYAGLAPEAALWARRGLNWSMLYLLFPATIIALALWDAQRAKPIPAFGWLGSISYAAYVVHFPMQLALALAIVHGLAPDDFAESSVAFVLFFVALALISRAVFVWLEEPVQRWMRRHLVAAHPSA
ncbi:MAG: acyltransferase [Hyphomonadaceae bacterium]|nr:acyltransferase [Hyphomonadaceae bacterium]